MCRPELPHWYFLLSKPSFGGGVCAFTNSHSYGLKKLSENFERWFLTSQTIWLHQVPDIYLCVHNWRKSFLPKPDRFSSLPRFVPEWHLFRCSRWSSGFGRSCCARKNSTPAKTRAFERDSQKKEDIQSARKCLQHSGAGGGGGLLGIKKVNSTVAAFSTEIRKPRKFILEGKTREECTKTISAFLNETPQLATLSFTDLSAALLISSERGINAQPWGRLWNMSTSHFSRGFFSSCRQKTAMLSFNAWCKSEWKHRPPPRGKQPMKNVKTYSASVPIGHVSWEGILVNKISKFVQQALHKELFHG